MKICIPIEFKPEGGGFYFLQSLSRYLEKSGHSVTSDIADSYDIIFTNHWAVPALKLLRGIRKNPNARLVQRIDGAAQDYGRDPEADGRQREVNMLADLTVFQSEYCRYSTREKFPVIPQDGPVINNPVDISLFRPAANQEQEKANRVAYITWSTNPKKGGASLYEVAKRNPDIKFALCGRFPDAPDLDNLEIRGVLGREELADTLRSCSVLLTFSQNEACPNHVLEGMASGLPILYGDSGAMREIIDDGGTAVTVDSFRQEYDSIMHDWKKRSELTRKRTELCFSPDIIFPKYIAAMERCITEPTRIPFFRRRMKAWISAVREIAGDIFVSENKNASGAGQEK